MIDLVPMPDITGKGISHEQSDLITRKAETSPRCIKIIWLYQRNGDSRVGRIVA